ncbi:lipopolysaccharide biosynthesis protein [Hymenobacter caeli]|uniref:O-antigen/teichoic acid export membrane protein n=1 Tax=Hymenobacter caeli TaxID=2735894 RepID=A0ABX2FYB2_9BACT|nr:oligosaccharide flippase family protein [Hymenobacter caeli]NRT21399.1 O-antigen/teichoic acid export membrane protein [Hymenobacter caeli]
MAKPFARARNKFRAAGRRLAKLLRAGPARGPGRRVVALPAPGRGARHPSASRVIKRFLGNISFVVLLNLAVKPGWILVENLVQDRLGHAAFGLVTALTSLGIMVAVLADLGLTPYAVRRVAAEPDFLGQEFPVLLPLRAALGLAALAAALPVGWALGYRGPQLGLLAAVTAALLLTQYGQFLRGPVQARQHFNTDALLSVLEKALLLAAILALLPGGLTLGGYVGARLGAAAFTAALLYGLFTRLFGRVPYRWHGPRARQALRATLPFALMTLLYGANERIDMVMLERLHSPAEAGYYAGAYRWVEAVMMYAWTVLPLFFAKFASTPHDADAQRRLLWFGQRVVAAPLLFVVAFGLFRGEVLFWQFGHSSPAELAKMALCLRILFLNVLVHAFFAIYSTLLTSTAHERAVSWAVAGSLALNVALNLWLLPRFGAVAAACNTLACAAAVSGAYLVLVARRTGVALPWALLARLLLAFGLLCGAWWAARAGLRLPWWLEAGLMAGVFGLIGLGTGLVRLAEIRQLLPGGRDN